MHGAIETNYKGYLFRSRLEARWAVFFDAAGIAWEYEPQGFTVKGECWLPDFYLPETRTWVEIKGSNEALHADWKRLATILDFDSPVPYVHGSLGCGARGVLLLGPIPEGKFGIHLHPLIQNHEALYRCWAMFVTRGLVSVDMSDEMFSALGVAPRANDIQTTSERWLIDSHYIETPRGWTKVIDAYKAARSARFEHGQVGAVHPHISPVLR